MPTCCAGKVKEVGERLTVGAATPVPVRLTVCVAGLALSVMVTAPVRVPAAVGLKVTLRVQLAPAATLEPQVLVWEKSPLAVMLVMLRAALPVLLERDALSAAAGAHRLCGESQGSGGEADHGRSAGSRQADGLGGRAGVIGDGQSAGLWSQRRWAVKVTLRVQLAPAARLDAAVVGLSKVAAVRPGDGHARDVERGVARVQ